MNDAEYGDALRAVRAREGWTQTEMARRIGMTTRNYQSLEMGKRGPSARIALAIERVSGVVYRGPGRTSPMDRVRQQAREEARAEVEAKYAPLLAAARKQTKNYTPDCPCAECRNERQSGLIAALAALEGEGT